MPQLKSRRELYSEATRAALLGEATRLFATRGYAGTSLEDVAAASRVTRGAVYHHFDGKQALFEAVLDAQEARAIAEITAAATSSSEVPAYPRSANKRVASSSSAALVASEYSSRRLLTCGMRRV